ncbi:MAG: FAD-dependent oxidoreductase [Burkholderiales bacterium]|nr:FAD-dependent oxidoreductase [Burkholderiales bacterium]
MTQTLKHLQFDVVVIGGGASGVAAAAAAGKNGMKTLLVEAGPMLGGELLSGMSIDGLLNARGQYVVGGISDELLAECKDMDGFVGPLHDYRLICYVCCDPEVMKIAVLRVLDRYRVKPLLYTLAEDVVMENGRVSGVILVNKSGRTLVSAKYFLDCSGDGDLAAMAGAPFEVSDASGELQPLSIMFRMANVDNAPLLEFARDHPENLAVGESDYIRGDKTDADLAREIYRQGQPCVFFKGDGPLIQQGLRDEEMFPTALIMIQPTSVARKEVCVNATRVARNIMGTDSAGVSEALPELLEQVWMASKFLRKRVPGFANASFAGIAPRVGIRETRRIMGEHVLTGDEAVNARKHKDVVAKGAQHVDIHQDGIKQVRIPIANGGSYDIPWGCLVPKKLPNVLVAGRCLSATREGMGTARTMGPCFAMGQAVGTAAAMSIRAGYRDVRQLGVGALQQQLREHGAVLDGVY